MTDMVDHGIYDRNDDDLSDDEYVADPAAVTWAGGQVRGPRTVPVTF